MNLRLFLKLSFVVLSAGASPSPRIGNMSGFSKRLRQRAGTFRGGFRNPTFVRFAFKNIA